MKRILSVITLAAFLMLSHAQTVLAGEPMVGEISIFAGDFPPKGYMFCEGQELPIPQHSALYTILGNRYGGDGKTRFALPDLRKLEKDMGGVRYIIAIEGMFPDRR